MPHTFAVIAQKLYGTTQSIGLRLHQENDPGENVRERRTRHNHLKDAPLPSVKGFFLLVVSFADSVSLVHLHSNLLV
jgi:hypothetical protein